MKLQMTSFPKRIWTQAPTAALHGNVRNWGNGIIPHHMGPKHFVIIHSQSKAFKQHFQGRLQEAPNWTLTAWLSILETTHWDKDTPSLLQLLQLIEAVISLSKSKHISTPSFPHPPPKVCRNRLTFKLGLLEHLHLADIDIVQRVNGLTGLLDVLANAVWDPEESHSTTMLKTLPTSAAAIQA